MTEAAADPCAGRPDAAGGPEAAADPCAARSDGEATDDGPFTAMVPRAEGRSYHADHRVRLGDVTPAGHVRLDAVARYLQDIAGDDVDDAGISGEAAWVVRRTSLQVGHRPGYEDHLDLVTWCSGTGAAWAERRTTVSMAGRAVIEASSLWVCMDPVTLRPKQLDDHFFAVYGQTPQSRPVPSRLRLPARPPAEATSRSWPLRRADFDVLGHVNNAVAWVALEEQVGPECFVVRAQVEYRQAIGSGGSAPPTDLSVASVDQDGVVGAWIVDGSGATAVSAVLRLSDPGPPPGGG
jgi:acyl-ACP thioesterase